MKTEKVISQYQYQFIQDGYVLNTLGQSEKDLKLILDFFKIMDSVYIPPLNTQVNIHEYANKIIRYADNFMLFLNKEGIGIISLYVNDFLKKEAFITSIGILPGYHGNKLAYKLLNFAIDYSVSKKMRKIKLEVSKENRKAIGLYIRNNFYVEDELNNNSLLLSNELNSHSTNFKKETE